MNVSSGHPSAGITVKGWASGQPNPDLRQNRRVSRPALNLVQFRQQLEATLGQGDIFPLG